MLDMLLTRLRHFILVLLAVGSHLRVYTFLYAYLCDYLSPLCVLVIFDERGTE
jgi:hypothetical protein